MSCWLLAILVVACLQDKGVLSYLCFRSQLMVSNKRQLSLKLIGSSGSDDKKKGRRT
jgi:hypothetical protein